MTTTGNTLGHQVYGISLTLNDLNCFRDFNTLFLVIKKMSKIQN